MIHVNTPFFQIPGGASGGPPDEPTLEQLQQQIKDTTKKYTDLQAEITAGKLVDPAKFLEAQEKAGDIYPAKRYQGLQAKFQTTQDDLLKLQEAKDKSEAKLSKLEKDLLETTKDLEEKNISVQALMKSQKRAMLIFTKFPDLAPFEAEHLLPEAEEEKLESVLAVFSEKLGKEREKAAKDFVSGGSISTPSGKAEGKPPLTEKTAAQAHLALANDAMAKNDFEKYNTEYDLYLSSLAKQTA